jgi:hypothetical protein
MTWRVESSPSASSTRTGILGSIRVSLADPAASSASSSSTSTTFISSSAAPPIPPPALLAGDRKPLQSLSLFSPLGRNRNWRAAKSKCQDEVEAAPAICTWPNHNYRQMEAVAGGHVRGAGNICSHSIGGRGRHVRRGDEQPARDGRPGPIVSRREPGQWWGYFTRAHRADIFQRRMDTW